MTLRPRSVATLLLALALGSPHPGAAQLASPDTDSEEAFLALRYAGVVDEVVSARYAGGVMYLPLGALLRALGVAHELDPARPAVRGSYGEPPRAFEIDAAAGAARQGEREVPLASGEVLVGNGEVYVAPALLDRVLGIAAEVDAGTLEVTLTSPEPLPVARAAEQRRQRARHAIPDVFQPPAPLRFGRERRWLNGGVVQYALGASRAAGGAGASYALAGGAEVLGGDLQGSLEGVVLEGRALSHPAGTARWRFVLPASQPLLRQAQLGWFPAGALRGSSIAGVRLTNEPIDRRTLIGSQAIAGEAPPGWEVELYVNGQLVDRTLADPVGNYRFVAPSLYGTSFVSVKQYGPGGEVVSQQRQLQVPRSFVPRGRLEYTAAAGRVTDGPGDGALLHAEARYGLTGWMTNAVGIERIGDGDPVAYDALSLRLPSTYLLGLDAAPGAFYRATLEAVYATHANVSLSYTRGGASATYNPLGRRHELRSLVFLPVRVVATPVSVNARGEAHAAAGGAWTYDLGASVLVNSGPLRPFLGYSRASGGAALPGGRPGERFEVGAYHAWSPARRPAALHGAFMTGRLGYEPGRGVRDVRVEVERGVSAAGRLGVAVGRDFGTGQTSLELRYHLELRGSRWAASAVSGATGVSLSQSVRGALGWDPVGGDLHASRQEWVGRSGAIVRPFLDANGNGARDAGEEPVAGAAVRFREAVLTSPTREGYLRVDDLVPYYRYSVEVEATGVANPLWTPAFQSFSFVTDPNVYKAIDVPFEAGAVVEGRVTPADGEGDAGLGGLPVRITRLDGERSVTTPTYSDGSIYLMGLAPGRYRASLDAAQLAALGLAAEPAEREFTVRPTREGDTVAGVDFVVRRLARQ